MGDRDMRLILLRCCALAAGLAVIGNASAAPQDYQIGFGPYFGGGSMSSGAKVSGTSGYTLSAARSFALAGSGLMLGPRIEVADGFLSAKANADGHGLTSTYDNRIFAGGFTLSHALGNDHTFAQGIYVNAMAGKAYSKLSVDDATDRTYAQSLYGNINGNYYAGEIGAWVPLHGSFGINLAFLGSTYAADQAARTGTYAGNQLNPDGSLALVSGAYPKGNGNIPDRVTLKTYAAKLGVAMGF